MARSAGENRAARAAVVDRGSAAVGDTELRWGGSTHVGNARQVNEDDLVLSPPVFAVIDGMGGHAHGDVASGLAAAGLAALGTSEGATHPADSDAVMATLLGVHEAIQAAAVGGADMGTTVVAAVVVDVGGELGWVIANVGDSRAYSYEAGALHQLSVDHSYVQELVDLGTITSAMARVHPDRNVVTRALGMGDGVEPDFWFRPIRMGERLLLCSDGVYGEVPDPRIAAILQAAGDPGDAVERLMAEVLAGPGLDNATAVVVERVGELAVEPVAASPDATTKERTAPRRRQRRPRARRVDGASPTVSDESPEGLIEVPEWS